MPGSVPQAGFYYQNHVAALKVLELLDFGSPITSIFLENYQKGPHIDDIIVVYSNFTRYYQIKWSQNDDKPFTLSNLTTPQEERAKALLQQLAEGYSSPHVDKEHAEIILYSTRGASNHKGRSKHSLQDFLNDIHTVFVTSPALTKLSDLPLYSEYEGTIGALRKTSGLDEGTFSKFLRCLRFELNQDDIQRQRQNVITKLSMLGIDEQLYDSLLNAVVEWSISGVSISKTDVLQRLGIANRFVDTIAHDYEVEEQYYVENTHLFRRLDESIAKLQGGFILVEGPPGSGKSTALTVYQRTRRHVKFAYYCFVPNEVGLGNRRMEKETFLKSLCIGIERAFPDVNFPQFYSQDYEDKLGRWLNKLSTLGIKIVFIIDGVDYVDRKKERLSHPLTTYLDGKLPENIFFLLSSQYPEALAPSIQTQIQQNSLRYISVQKFSEPEIKLFLDHRGLRLTAKERALVTEKTEGIPLYLNYIAKLLLDTPSHAYEAILKELPSIKDETIDSYHEYLYEHISHNELTVWLLAILAQRKEYTTTAILLELLALLDFKSNALQVEQSVRTFKHLLKVLDGNMYAIFHNSFREFLLEKTKHLAQVINTALTGHYRNNPSSDESYRHFYRHLFDLNQYREILSHCNEEWLKQSWRDFRPLGEMNANIDIAWEAAMRLGSLKEFIRIALLKQQLAVMQFNLESADHDYAAFLLSIGKVEDAIRRVWDGERVQYSLVEFSQFVLDYFEYTGHLLPVRAVRVGFSKPTEQLNPREVSTYFQAQALYWDWARLFNKVDRYQWVTTKHPDYLLQHSPKEENERINASIKENIIEVLFTAKKYESLLAIGRDPSISHALRNQAIVDTIDLFLTWNEVSGALELIKSLDFQQLHRLQYQRLILRLYEHGCFDRVQASLTFFYLPPLLTSARPDENMSSDLDERFTMLYNDLRVYFLQNPAGYSVYTLRAGALGSSDHAFFAATVELAFLWCNQMQSSQDGVEASRKIRKLLTDLHDRLEDIDANVRDDDDHYTERMLALYRHIFEFTTSFLTPSQISEVAEHWLHLDADADRYWTTSIDFAKYLKDHKASDLETVIYQLLRRSETQARTREETSVLVKDLIGCAKAYGYCGFEQDATRLWDDLFMLACGIYYRKDYQFNEAISVLRSAHRYHPEMSLQRLVRLLGLAHQLENVAQHRTVAWAIEELIVFSCELSAGLALELLQTEDLWIHRERAIKALTRTLMSLPNSNLWHTWAIIKTMDKWDGLIYDDDTYLAMLQALKAALKSNNLDVVRDIYVFSRHQFLVERNAPWHVFEFADLCRQFGVTWSEIENDLKVFRVDWESRQSDKEIWSSYTRRFNIALPDLQEVEDVAQRNIEELFTLLENLLSQYARLDREKEVKGAYDDLKKSLAAFHQSLPLEEQKALEARSFSLRRRFIRFKNEILALEVSTSDNVARVNALAEDLLLDIANLLDKEAWDDYLHKNFDYEKWVSRFAARIGHSVDLFKTDLLKTYILTLIGLSPLTQLRRWVWSCRKWFLGNELSQTLVAVAKRLKKVDPNYCQSLLMEAWKANQDFFYLNGSQSTSEFLGILFEIDAAQAKAILLGSFYYQYKQYPRELIYHLDQIIEFADYFEEQDFYEYVYDEYERYNVRLTAGLLEKEMDYGWIENYDLSLPTEQAIMQYLVRLFEYPQVEIRKLALRSLYQLILRDSSIISSILVYCNNQSENVKEHVLSLLLSVTVHQPDLLAAQKHILLSFLNEPHFNIKEQIKEMLLYYAERGGKLEQFEIDRLRSVNTYPQILLPMLVEGGLQRGERFIPSPYQVTLLEQLERFQEKDHDVIERVYTRILRYGWTTQSGLVAEGATRREHNINTNFDTIEINGPYFQSVQKALNAVFDQGIRAQEYDDKAIQTVGPYFRLYDPSDVFTTFEKRPQSVNWIDLNTSDEGFLAFTDIEERLADFANREEETITVYEDGHQRSGDEIQRMKRSTYFRIVAFLVASDQPQALDQLEKRRLRPYMVVENRYRFEVPTVFQNGSTFPIPGIRPIIGISENAFRGQNELSIASLLPDTIERLGLTRESLQSLNYLKDNGPAVNFFSWQEAFDKERRRQKPTSAIVSLRIKRKVLDNYLDTHGYHLHFLLTLRRATDKYIPEEDMDWRYFEVIY